MTAKNFNKTLIGLLDRTAFQEFAVELQDGQRFEIDRPRARVVREGMALFIGSGFKLIEFDHKKVKKFIDGPADLPRANSKKLGRVKQ